MSDFQKKKTILIAEDEPSLMHILSDKLTQSGFKVIEAADGEKCLELLNESNPDLILLDMIMPKMDGRVVLEKIKNDENKKNIPVIMLTNLSGFEDIQESINKGADDYLIKADWSLKEIVKKIEEKLKLEK